MKRTGSNSAKMGQCPAISHELRITHLVNNLKFSSAPLVRRSAASQTRFLPELIFSVICAVVLGAQLVRYSPYKPMWIDEILSYYQVAGKSPAAAIASLDTGLNLLPSGYFLLLATVLQRVEFSPLVARGLSSVFIMATVPVMLFALRRYVGRWFAMLGVAGVIFTSPLIFFHNSEARPYGLLLFLVALVGLAFVQSAEEKNPAPHTLILLVVANGLVAMSAYFGGLYSAAAFAVTIFFDWRKGWFRPRVYGAYLLGWGIFAVTTLPLCFQQLAARGAAGTQWLPSFGSAWRQLLKQWTHTLYWVPVAIVLIGIIFWAARKRDVRSARTTGAKADLPEPILRLAALALLWLMLPIGFILQARITGRNFYFNRYFIGSDLGLMVLVALLFALLCRQFTGSMSLENAALRRPLFLSATRFTVVCFLCAAAFHFLTRHDPPRMGLHDAVVRANHWTVPKVTFDLEVYVEGSFQANGGTGYWYIPKSNHETAAFPRFWQPFQMTDPQKLTNFGEFLFIDSNQRPADFDLETWARQQNYRVSRVGDYRDVQGRSKIFYLVQSNRLSLSH